MKSLIKRISLILVTFLLCTVNLNGQTFSLVKSSMEITGTSTLHDWEMTSDQAIGYVKGVLDHSGLLSINSLKVSMPIRSLRSGKSVMDKITYDVMKAKEHKNVIFELISAEKKGHIWEMKGYFTMAGTKKQVLLNVTESVIGRTVTLIGAYTFNLTDFKIEPPIAMYGTIETGDKVSINFNLQFK